MPRVGWSTKKQANLLCSSGRNVPFIAPDFAQAITEEGKGKQRAYEKSPRENDQPPVNAD